MLEKLACFSAEHKADEQLNIELAIKLCESEDKAGIKEIVVGLTSKKDIANDCIKVLYEIGERKPLLIKDYADNFLKLLTSKNNRLVWGGMTALGTIAEYNANELFKNLDTILSAYKNGSVITIDHSITVLAKICKKDKKYEEKIFPILINHLETCRIKEIPQHAERMLLCINNNNKNEFLKVLNNKKQFFTQSQLKRINKIIKNLEE